MLYKSSLLALTFLLLSVSNVIAADFPSVESTITEKQLELIVDVPELATDKSQSSASIAKARLRRISAKKSETDLNLKSQITTTIKSQTIDKKTIKDQIKNTVHVIPSSIASLAPEAITYGASEAIVATSTKNQPDSDNISLVSSKSTEQSNIASAILELNNLKQWELNKSVKLNDVLFTPAPIPTIVQAPERFPGSSIPSSVIETPKPVITKPTAPTIGTQEPVTTTTEVQKPAIAKPTDPIIETKKPEPPKPLPQVIEAQKPEPQNNEPKKWAVGVHTQLSTTGFIGVDAGYKFSPNLHARFGLNTVGFNLDYASQGINYKASVNPTNVHLLGDFFPFGEGLRLTGGLVFQSNQFNATGTPSSSITGGITQVNIGGANYDINQVGSITSEGSFSNSVAPYLGIGFGTPLSPGLGFNLDAGVMFAGSPRVKLRANNIPSTVPTNIQADIRTSLAEQERKTNNDIGSFGVYPVISVGISYAF
jgi:hypothetical protein